MVYKYRRCKMKTADNCWTDIVFSGLSVSDLNFLSGGFFFRSATEKKTIRNTISGRCRTSNRKKLSPCLKVCFVLFCLFILECGCWRFFFLKYRQRCVPQKRLVVEKVYSISVTSALAFLHVRVNFFNQITSIIQGFESAPFWLEEWYMSSGMKNGS